MRITSKIRVPLFVRWTALVVVFAIGMGGIGYGVNDALNQANNAEQFVTERCESGNDLRRGLRHEKTKEIQFLRKLPTLFPGAPSDIFQDYVKAEIEVIKKNRNTIFAPREC